MKTGGRVLVIGLGQFGSSVAEHLSELGVDVIAIDNDEQRVQTVSDFVAQTSRLPTGWHSHMPWGTF